MKNTTVRDYGCSGQGGELDTHRIQNAIDDCHADGGGIVYFPPGRYLSGSIQIKSNVTLCLEENALLEASTDIKDYPTLPHLEPIHILFGQGEATSKSSAFLYACRADNVAITGKGKISGRGEAFMTPIETPTVPDYVPGWHSVPHYWSAPKSRPETLVNFYDCSNILIKDVTLQNSFAWTLTFFLSDHISVQNIQIDNQTHLMNADGIDIVDSSHVHISNCQISCADDGICLKNINWKHPIPDRPRRPVENVTVTNCLIKTCCSGFKLGTDSQHGFRNIFFSNSNVSTLGTNNDPLSFAITGIAIESVDGGSISNISASDITMDNVRCPFFIRLANRGRNMNPARPGILQEVNISNINAKGCILPGMMMGIPDAKIKNVNLANINIYAYGKEYPYLPVGPIGEEIDAYPEAVQFGPLPSYGLYGRHADAIRVSNGRLSLENPDSRPPMLFEDVKSLIISNINTPEGTINITENDIA